MAGKMALKYFDNRGWSLLTSEPVEMSPNPKDLETFASNGCIWCTLWKSGPVSLTMKPHVDMQHPCLQQEDPCFLVSMDTDCTQGSTCRNLYHRHPAGIYTDYHPVSHYKHNEIHLLVHYTGSRHLPQLLWPHSDAEKKRRSGLILI